MDENTPQQFSTPSSDMFVYRGDEGILSIVVLLSSLVGAFLYVFDMNNVGFFITNPLIYFLVGIIFYFTKRAYTPNNHFSYFIIDGKPAKNLGVSLIIFSLVSALFLNIIEPMTQFSITQICVGQIVLYVAILIYFSSKYGEIVVGPGH